MLSNPFESAALFIGSEIESRYRIEQEIGSGGVGAVYRATHLKLGRPVAIKVLQQQFGASAELRERFEREAQALAALSHPHVVTVTDYGIFRRMPYLVMELLEGETLSDHLRAGPLDPDEALDIARQLLRALSFVHERGMVHRDLKPANIFLQSVPGSRPHVKLLDFGLAKFVAPEADQKTLTRAGQVFGTPSYMAPEQVASETTEPATDVYAVGIILFEMLTGKTPYDGDVAEVMRKHLLVPLPPLEQACAERQATPALSSVLAKATAKSRSERYEHAMALAEALNALPTPFVIDRSGQPRAPAHDTGAPAGASASLPPSKSLKIALLPLLAIVGFAALLLYLQDGNGQLDATRPVEAVETETVEETRSKTLSGTSLAPARSGAAPGARPERPNSAPSAATPSPAAAHEPSLTMEQLWERAPKLLVASLDAVNQGTPLSRRTMTYVHKYNAEHPGDPRGHLVLARSHLERGWRRDAVNEYAIAYKLNPDVIVDPGMLDDLIELVVHGSKTAADLVRNAYGSRAIPAMDRALEKQTVDRRTRERLQKLRSDLEK